MQRMELLFKGLEVPALGSVKDRVLRSYLAKQAQLEAKKAEFTYMIALATPSFKDESGRQTWNDALKQTYGDYVHMLHGHAPQPDLRSAKEKEMLDFYENTVKDSKMILTHKRGQRLYVEGFVKSKDKNKSS